ncbi:MAG: hypothetical protein R3F61_19080 [Myxococcota bacterium]
MPVFVWLLGCMAAMAGEAQLKVLVMPLTPADDYQTEFHALIPYTGAEAKQWAPSHAGFECVANGDFVEVWARKTGWPSELPKSVACASGDEVLKAKIRIVDRNLEPMFVADGSLVMPREKKASAVFKGAPPRQDFGVQQGKTGSLAILCKITPGPVLEVTAYPSMPDGEGRCTLQTKLGEVVQFPVRIRTIKRAP